MNCARVVGTLTPLLQPCRNPLKIWHPRPWVKQKLLVQTCGCTARGVKKVCAKTAQPTRLEHVWTAFVRVSLFSFLLFFSFILISPGRCSHAILLLLLLSLLFYNRFKCTAARLHIAPLRYGTEILWWAFEKNTRVTLYGHRMHLFARQRVRDKCSRSVFIISLDDLRFLRIISDFNF